MEGDGRQGLTRYMPEGA